MSASILFDTLGEQANDSNVRMQQAPRARTVALVVDDDAIVREGLRPLLEREGIAMIEAEDAKCAIEVMSASHVDVLISDQSMPGMTGLELLKETRKMFPRIRRLLLSGYSLFDLGLHSVGEAQPDFVIRKGNIAELISALRVVANDHLVPQKT